MSGLFARLDLDALDLITDKVPALRQHSALSTYVAFRRAAVEAKDFDATQSYTLRQIAKMALAPRSDKRVRESLRDLAASGLVRAEPQQDEHGGTRSTLYVLLTPWDESSHPRDNSSHPMGRPAGQLVPPQRAREKGRQETGEPPPYPPQAGGDRVPPGPTGKRKRDLDADAQALAALAAEWFPADPKLGAQVIAGARGIGKTTKAEVVAYTREWYPHLVELRAAS